jgi:signal peptidase I
MIKRFVEQTLRVLVGFVFSLALLYIASLLALWMLGYEYAAVVSNSMSPMTSRGDLVILEKRSRIQVGDVVTFNRGGTQVLHRLFEEVDDDFWKTKGDANVTPDPWKISTADVELVAAGRIRGFGWPLLFVRNDLVARSVETAWIGSNQTSAAVSSKIYGSTYTSWSKYGANNVSSVYSFGNITLGGTGERLLVSRYVLPNSSRLYMNSRLTNTSAGADFFGVVFNGCIATDGSINCGWYVQIDATTAKLRTITGTHQTSEVLATCSHSSSPVVITVINKYIIQKNASSIYLTVNGRPCLLSTNLQQLLLNNGLVAPTGTTTGFWMRGNTGVRSDRTNVYQ